jgi:hypothetical protein
MQLKVAFVLLLFLTLVLLSVSAFIITENTDEKGNSLVEFEYNRGM